MKGVIEAVENKYQLVQQAINQNADAFEQLLINEERKMYYTALSYVGKQEDALDVIQETAYKAFLAIKNLREPEYFSTWLIAILIRECYQLLRKRNKMIPYEENELLMKLSYTENNTVDHLYLKEMIEKLPEDYQTVIVLFYYHDLALRDIATVIERPIGTVKTYLHRARQQLKKELERGYSLDEKAT